MDLVETGRAIALTLGAVGGPPFVFRVLSALFPNRRTTARAELQRDLELFEKLPTDGASRATLRKHIDLQVEVLVNDLATARRDWMSVGIAIFFGAGAAGLGYIAYAVDDWWRWLVLVAAIICALFLIVGLSMGAPLVPRDEKGNAIPTSDK